MPCSAADAPTAKDAFDKAVAGDMGGAMALLGNLDGGMAGTCGACLLAHQSTPDTAMPECVGPVRRRQVDADDALVARGWPLLIELLGVPKDAKASGYSSFCPVWDNSLKEAAKSDDGEFMRCFTEWGTADRLIVGSVAPSEQIVNLERCKTHAEAGDYGEGKEKKFLASYSELLDDVKRPEADNLKDFCDKTRRTNSNATKLAMTMWGGSFTFALSLSSTTDYIDMIRATRSFVDEQGAMTPVITDSPYAKVVPRLHCWNGGIPFDFWEQYLTIEWVL